MLHFLCVDRGSGPLENPADPEKAYPEFKQETPALRGDHLAMTKNGPKWEAKRSKVGFEQLIPLRFSRN